MNDDEVYLRHILDAIEIIREYAEAGEEIFKKDRMRQDAIIRRLGVTGDATKQLAVAMRPPAC